MITEPSQRVTYTTCQICEQVCGLAVTSIGDQITSILPDKQNPYSWRDFCIKASTSDRARSHPNRIRKPMKRVGERYQAVPYEDAIGEIAAKLNDIVDQFGSDSVADYLGQPGSISYNNGEYHNAFFNRLGTNNRYQVGSVDHNAPLLVCRNMYGSPAVWLQTDVDRCDCLMLVGSNPAISGMGWLGRVSDGWNRILRRIEAGADLIVVDPRRTESARHATIHIAPLPETDWAFLLGVIAIIITENWQNERDCARVKGFDSLRDIALSADLPALARTCDVPVEAIKDVATRFAKAATAACVARTGPSQGRNGGLAEWLCQTLNVITGRMDQPGGRIFPTFPSNLLSAKPPLGSEKPSRVRGIVPVEGYRSLAELPDEILTPGEGQVRALFLNAANPVTCGPESGTLAEALRQLDLLVAIDLFQRESQRDAHWLIPGVHFLERDEVNVMLAEMNDEAYIGVIRAAVPPPEGVRPEWMFFRDLAAAMGLSLFSDSAILEPYDLSRQALAAGGKVTLDEVLASQHGVHRGRHEFGHFFASIKTDDGRIDLCPSAFVELLRSRLAELGKHEQPSRPFQIVNRRSKQMMNSWLVETAAKGVRNPRSDTVEINQDDAARLGLNTGDRVELESDVARIAAVVIVSDDVRPGVLVMDHGWGSGLFDPVEGKLISRVGINRNLLVDRHDLDPLTAVPGLNGTRVTMTLVTDLAIAGS